MSIAQASKRMIEILNDDSLLAWDISNKIAMLVEEFNSINGIDI